METIYKDSNVYQKAIKELVSCHTGKFVDLSVITIYFNQSSHNSYAICFYVCIIINYLWPGKCICSFKLSTYHCFFLWIKSVRDWALHSEAEDKLIGNVVGYEAIYLTTSVETLVIILTSKNTDIVVTNFKVVALYLIKM